jgi:hypothetical protein
VLASLGQRVLVLERHEVIGGGAHMYVVAGGSSSSAVGGVSSSTKGGNGSSGSAEGGFEGGNGRYKFDSGLHYTIPEAATLLAIIAAGTQASPVPIERMGEPRAEAAGELVYDRILLAGSGDDELLIANDRQLMAELHRRFPTHRHALDAFAACARGCCSASPSGASQPSCPTGHAPASSRARSWPTGDTGQARLQSALCLSSFRGRGRRCVGCGPTCAGCGSMRAVRLSG